MKYTLNDCANDVALLARELLGWQIIFIEMFAGSVFPGAKTGEWNE